jgi:hypothetical protein
MMCAGHSAVDHLKGIGNQPGLFQCAHDLLPETREVPTSKLAVDAGPLAELFRQVTPRQTGAREPQNAIQNKTMVRGFASFVARTARMKHS